MIFTDKEIDQSKNGAEIGPQWRVPKVACPQKRTSAWICVWMPGEQEGILIFSYLGQTS